MKKNEKEKIKIKKKAQILPKDQKKKQSIPIKIIKTAPLVKSEPPYTDFRKIKESFEMPKGELAAAEAKEEIIFTKPQNKGFHFLFKGKTNNLKIKITNLSEAQRIKLLWCLVGLSGLIIFIGWSVNFKNILNKQDKNNQNNFSFLKNELENSYQKFQTSFPNINQENNPNKLNQELKIKNEEEKISDISHQMMEKINQK